MGTYYCACAIRTKWRLIHPETPVELPVSPFDSLAEFIGSSSVGYRVDWCKNHRLPSSSVGVMMKKKKKMGLDRFPCITVAVYFSYFGSVIG